jgi:hypothetical protein
MKRLPLALEFLKLRSDGTPETSSGSVSKPLTVTSVEDARIVAGFFKQKLQHVQWDIEENNALFESLTNENLSLQMPVDSETGILDTTKKRKRSTKKKKGPTELEKQRLDKIKENELVIEQIKASNYVRYSQHAHV